VTAVLALLAVLVPIWDGDQPTPRRADRNVEQWIDITTWNQALADAEADRLASLQLTQPPAPPRSIWDDLAECESGGDWSINTGNGFYGGLQFSLTSWRGVGGSGYPHHHTRAEQIHRAELLLDVQGWGAWPACSRRLGLR
jgi:hypothetical protein